MIRVYGKVKRQCDVCGKHFFVVASVVKRGFGKYCSMDCRNSAFKNGKASMLGGYNLIRLPEQEILSGNYKERMVV